MAEVQPYQICVIGNAKSPSDNPITLRFSQFFITFIADGETGVISECEASMTLALTSKFIAGLFVGRSLARVDEELIELVRTRYLGSSQKAVIVAYKDAVRKFRSRKNGIILPD